MDIKTKGVRLRDYSECKPRFALLVAWRLIQSFFRLLPHFVRVAILRLMGARIGTHCLLYRSVVIHCPWNLRLGNYVCIGPRVELYDKAEIVVGDNVVISQDAYICTAGHDVSSPVMAVKNASVIIGENVWIAARATLLPGVHIGNGVVVGACAVVAQDIPEWKIVVGNPAEIIKDRYLNKR